MNIYIPEELKQYLAYRRVKKIVKAHRSGDLVYQIDNEYILKISNQISRLLREKQVNDYLQDKLPVSKSVEFIIVDNVAYYLKTYVKGDNLVSKKYLNNPVSLVKLLASGIKLFHSIDAKDCELENNYSTGNCFIHGDFCLPNILVKDNQVTGFIDVEAAGFGDPWADYAWAIWSLEYNLKTDKYTKMLLDELNIEFNEEKYKKYIN